MKKKTCTVCENVFDYYPNVARPAKYCSQKCWFVAHARKEKECPTCKTMFKPRFTSSKHCSPKCYAEAMSKNRMGKNNPAYVHGQSSQNGKRVERFITAKHLRACSKYRKAFLQKNDYIFCEVCGVNSSMRFEVHHIYFASLYPKHENLHDFRNLILVCIQCHNNFHAGKKYKEQFERLEKDRGLKELFAD